MPSCLTLELFSRPQRLPPAAASRLTASVTRAAVDLTGLCETLTDCKPKRILKGHVRGHFSVTQPAARHGEAPAEHKTRCHSAANHSAHTAHPSVDQPHPERPGLPCPAHLGSNEHDGSTARGHQALHTACADQSAASRALSCRSPFRRSPLAAPRLYSGTVDGDRVCATNKLSVATHHGQQDVLLPGKHCGTTLAHHHNPPLQCLTTQPVTFPPASTPAVRADEQGHRLHHRRGVRQDPRDSGPAGPAHLLLEGPGLLGRLCCGARV